jgi:hypothetical protein
METETGRGDITAGDIGGTKTGLAICSNEAGPHLPWWKVVFQIASIKFVDGRNQ